MNYLNLFFGAFLSDLLVKKYAEARLPMGEKISVLGDRIWIRKLHNRGAAGGFLADRQGLLMKVTFGMLAAIAGYTVLFLRGERREVEKIGASLLLAGGFCNWFDRLHQGFVTDYFSFNCRPEKIRNLVFNFSDFFIFIGTVFMMLGSLVRERNRTK